MTLRRSIRKAIQRGGTVHATVEAYHLGYATVRLADKGARLTNLSTQGAVVKAGDKVIVDYSAGVRPVVRPLFIPEYEPEELEIDQGKEVIYNDDDWSCAVTVWIGQGYGLDPWGNDPNPFDAWSSSSREQGWWKANEPWKVNWGDNTMQWAISCEYFDVAEGSAGMYNEDDNFGQNYLEIKRTGRYLITGKVEFDDIDGNRTTGVPELYNGTWYVMDYAYHPITGEPRTPYNNDGYWWMAISKNDVIVAKNTYRITECGGWTQSGLDGPYPIINAIVWCNYGDKIALVIWENNNGPYYWPGWGFPSSGSTDSNGLSVAYIPGSDRSIYQAVSSQSAYMWAHSQQQSVYLLGTIDGDNWKKSAYTAGGLPAGGEDQVGGLVPDAHIPAYLEGDSGAGGGDSDSSINVYLAGN